MKKRVLSLLFVSFCSVFLLSKQCEDDKGAENYNIEQTKRGDYSNIERRKCENEGSSQKNKGKTEGTNETSYNKEYAKRIGAKSEETICFFTDNKEKSHVRIDIITDKYVIEAGIDKGGSLDSIQQVLFFSILTGKKPAVIIYDTDGKEGVYEFRIKKVSEKVGIDFCRVRTRKVFSRVSFRRLRGCPKF